MWYFSSTYSYFWLCSLIFTFEDFLDIFIFITNLIILLTENVMCMVSIRHIFENIWVPWKRMCTLQFVGRVFHKICWSQVIALFKFFMSLLILLSICSLRKWGLKYPAVTVDLPTLLFSSLVLCFVYFDTLYYARGHIEVLCSLYKLSSFSLWTMSFYGC